MTATAERVVGHLIEAGAWDNRKLRFVERFAHRWLRRMAGLFDPPPKMVETITDWVTAQVAATAQTELERGLAEEQDNIRNFRKQPHVRKLLDAMKEVEELAPKAGTRDLARAYKTFWEASLGVFGYYVPQLKNTAFTGLKDPMRRAEIVRSIGNAVTMAEERLESQVGLMESHIKRLREEIRGYESFITPGAKPLGKESRTHRFELDLEGWRHGGQDLVEAAIDQEMETLKKFLSAYEERGKEDPSMAEFAKHLRNQIENRVGEWSHITVSVKPYDDDGARGSWQPFLKVLSIQVPLSTSPATLKAELHSIMEHELRHFAQSFLADVKGVGDATMKERVPGPGMPSRHIMTPQYQQTQERVPRSRSAPNPYQLHHLDDVEFYTDLPDAISRIRKQALRLRLEDLKYGGSREPLSKEKKAAIVARMTGGKVPREYKEWLRYVSIDPFFLSLKDFAKPKWRKAVKEAYKAIVNTSL